MLRKSLMNPRLRKGVRKIPLIAVRVAEAAEVGATATAGEKRYPQRMAHWMIRIRMRPIPKSTKKKRRRRTRGR